MSQKEGDGCECCVCFFSFFLFVLIIGIGGFLFTTIGWALFGLNSPVIVIFSTVGIVISLVPACYVVSWIHREQKQSRTKRRAKFRRRLANRQALSDLTPREFEQAVARILQLNGYKVQLTPERADYGADIIVQKQGRSYVVEVKQYPRTAKIGRPALQRLQGAMLHYRTHGMIFITLGYFTLQSIEYAKQAGIQLIDGDELMEMAARSYHITAIDRKTSKRIVKK